MIFQMTVLPKASLKILSSAQEKAQEFCPVTGWRKGDSTERGAMGQMFTRCVQSPRTLTILSRCPAGRFR